jgi:hypothetical protein
VLRTPLPNDREIALLSPWMSPACSVVQHFVINISSSLTQDPMSLESSQSPSPSHLSKKSKTAGKIIKLLGVHPNCGNRLTQLHLKPQSGQITVATLYTTFHTPPTLSLPAWNASHLIQQSKYPRCLNIYRHVTDGMISSLLLKKVRTVESTIYLKQTSWKKL